MLNFVSFMINHLSFMLNHHDSETMGMLVWLFEHDIQCGDIETIPLHLQGNSKYVLSNKRMKQFSGTELML